MVSPSSRRVGARGVHRGRTTKIAEAMKGRKKWWTIQQNPWNQLRQEVRELLFRKGVA